MKEFEKFWNNYWLSYSSYVGSEQRLAKATWKVALEWVLKNLKESYERLAPGDMGWEGRFIEEELND